jgi:hypothetical protein
MDFGFIRASSDDYQRPNLRSDRVVDSYDGYSSYLLIVDNKSLMTWIFPTRSKSPPLEIIRLFLRTFGRDQNVGGFIRCDQGGKLARSHTLVDMALTEFGYKVEPTSADSPSQNGKAEKWNNTFQLLLGPYSTALHWRQNTGRQPSSMWCTYTIVGSTHALESPPSKAGGASNLT